MMRALLALILSLSIGHSIAQGKRHDGGRERQMSREDRQRMRDDVRDAYRDRQERPQRERQQQMSPEQREQLRRDIQDANKDLKR